MPRINRSIAILGANGRLGRAALTAFHNAGWQVRAVTRYGKGDFPAGIETAAANALDETQLIAATKGVSFIFNGLNPVYTDWADKVMPLARNVVSAARANGCVHLFPGNVYDFGSSIPAVPTEETQPHPDHRKARLRVQAEKLFAEEAARSGVQTLILRAGDFFGGPARGSWFDLVIAAGVAKDKVTYPGPRDVVHAWAYLPDLSRAFVAMAENAHGLGRFETFHFGGHNVTGNQLHSAIEKATGRNMKTAGFPWAIIRLGGLVYPMWREISEMAYLWQRPHALRGDKLETVTGPLPRTPLDVAVRDALDALGLAVVPRRRSHLANASMAA